MPTWDEIRAHLRGRYLLLVDRDDWLGMVWTFTRDAEVIEQRLKIERGRAFDNDWLIIVAAVCLAQNIVPAGALEFNARLALGALVVADGRCYLRATMPIDTLAWRDLDQAIEHVAREAARLRRPREPPGGEPFKLFED